MIFGKLPGLFFASLLLASSPLAAAEFDAVAFSPETWPGRAPAAIGGKLAPLAATLHDAMLRQDSAAFDAARLRVVDTLGRYAGVPSDRPVYGRPIVPAAPDRAHVQRIWTEALSAQTGRFGWEQAARVQPKSGAGGKAPRLRVSQRQITALLRSYEAGLPLAPDYLRTAIAGLDYLLTAQSSSGVFGYPYEPAGPGLRRQAAETVKRGQSRGIAMVERDWVIEDLGDGGLNFDNGMCGLVLLHGYALVGDVRYLESAQRAAAWAQSRRLALNFNYNGFSGALFARLYRVTRDPKWLEAAKPVFEFGVLRGQLPNGRWFDQHNAKTQYHAILCWQLGEYLMALKLADDPLAATVERRLAAGLDNLAAELLLYGTGNAEEALTIEALGAGLLAVGERGTWRRALQVATNYVCGPFVPLARERGGHVPETVAFWLLLSSSNSRFKESSPGSMTFLRPDP